MGVRADAETLRRIPIFRDCEAVPLQVLSFAAERQRFDAGALIIKENKASQSAYFILDGTAQISRNGQVLGRAEPGALLGETAMLGSGSYMITAKAETIVYAAVIENELFKRVAREYPEFGEAVLAALSAKLGSSVDDLEKVRQLMNKAGDFSSL